MNTTQTFKVTSSERFLLLYIESVLAYTKSDPAFASQLAAALTDLRLPSPSLAENSISSAYTIPTDQADALCTTRWIIHTLQSHPEYKTAASHLAHWTQSYESPKDVVLGIVGLAIIGPTLGIVSTKKKKKRKSQLVMTDTYFAKLNSQEIAQLNTQLTQKVIAREITLAGGNVYNLHPDSAAWCIEDAQNKIYIDTEAHVQSLLQTAKSEGLSHVAESDSQGNVVAIAISPSVNDSLVEDSTARSI